MQVLRQLMSRWRIVVPAIAVTAGTMAAGVSLLDSRLGATTTAPADLRLAAPDREAPLPPLATASYADAVAEVLPAVVTVRVERRAETRGGLVPDDPIIRRFFRGMPIEPDQAPVLPGLGSGVIVTGDGRILTNHHVVDGAEHLNVVLADGRELVATVVGTDEPTDLAVLDIDATGLPTVPMADSDRVRVGDVVLAVGNPLGIGQTVTMGIISATGRTTHSGGGAYEDFLQTDAPINRGNSGGALITTGGELVGINSQIVSPSPTGGNIGIGFAIPSNLARTVMTQLVTSGRVRRGMLGVTVQPVTSTMAESLGLDAVQGAIVASVEADGPADRAGVRQGDVILRVDDVTIDNSNDLRNRISAVTPGDTVRLDLVRNSELRQLSVTLGEMPADARSASSESPARGELGMALEAITPELAARLGLPPTATGLVIADVDPGSAAGRAGLQPGDRIRTIDGREVTTAAEVRSALREARDRPALLMIERGGQPLFIALPTS